MSEYIEREAAINVALMDDIDKDFPRMDIAARLHDIPAADVRPVVLCGDCEFYGCRMDALREVGFCKRTDAITGAFDFCSQGEKREES